ncbi:MAG TPA: hypothetical protein P5026_01895 [Kiritimatiellia bacterium]|nr:hypothetical protein [Kiritimatiellia bacterium]HRU69858.1 hypothetical protein [Kiritimatiellia bacterium]
MHAWWGGLTALNRGFFCAAVFFGVLFVWQLVATLWGLGGDGLADGDVPADHMVGGDATETMSAFKLLSIRSIVTFLTLFSWGGALYLADGYSVQKAVGLASLWGAAGMLVVALLLHTLPKLAHTGNLRLATSVGAAGNVYVDIPAGGEGEVRTEVDGVVSYVKARAADGQAIKAGTAVVIERVVVGNRVEVRAVEKTGG